VSAMVNNCGSKELIEKLKEMRFLYGKRRKKGSKKIHSKRDKTKKLRDSMNKVCGLLSHLVQKRKKHKMTMKKISKRTE
jgi:hypothetical protein